VLHIVYVVVQFYSSFNSHTDDVLNPDLGGA